MHPLAALRITRAEGTRPAAQHPSARKQMLWWVVSAAMADTRARRIAAEAEAGRRVGR